jgi:hypothetical protein
VQWPAYPLPPRDVHCKLVVGNIGLEEFLRCKLGKSMLWILIMLFRNDASGYQECLMKISHWTSESKHHCFNKLKHSLSYFIVFQHWEACRSDHMYMFCTTQFFDMHAQNIMMHHIMNHHFFSSLILFTVEISLLGHIILE